MSTNQIVERIQTEIINSGRDTRYLIGSYEFLLNGMEFFLATIGEKRHVSGQELSKGLLLFANKQFGPLAKTVLNHWGVRNTGDFGNIVYNMIDLGIFSKQPEDSIEHFNNAVDFEVFLNKKYRYKIDKSFIKKLKES